MSTKLFTETDLARLAQQAREKAGKSKAEVARDLGVHRATISIAEQKPHQSLTSLRIRMIEMYSNRKVSGPFFSVSRRDARPNS